MVLQCKNRNIIYIKCTIHSLVLADRKRYYDAFDDYARTGSPHAMTMIIAEYLSERMASMLDILKQLQK